MKKIINGKMYNTDTAEELVSWDNDMFPNDFDYFSAELYKKRTGEYFLYEEGGAMTELAKRTKDGWCAGERISPLTEEMAKVWAEKHISADKYVELFGEVEE